MNFLNKEKNLIESFFIFKNNLREFILIFIFLIFLNILSIKFNNSLLSGVLFFIFFVFIIKYILKIGIKKKIKINDFLKEGMNIKIYFKFLLTLIINFIVLFLFISFSIFIFLSIPFLIFEYLEDNFYFNFDLIREFIFVIFTSLSISYFFARTFFSFFYSVEDKEYFFKAVNKSWIESKKMKKESFFISILLLFLSTLTSLANNYFLFFISSAISIFSILYFSYLFYQIHDYGNSLPEEENEDE